MEIFQLIKEINEMFNIASIIALLKELVQVMKESDPADRLWRAMEIVIKFSTSLQQYG